MISRDYSLYKSLTISNKHQWLGGISALIASCTVFLSSLKPVFNVYQGGIPQTGVAFR